MNNITPFENVFENSFEPLFLKLLLNHNDNLLGVYILDLGSINPYIKYVMDVNFEMITLYVNISLIFVDIQH